MQTNEVTPSLERRIELSISMAEVEKDVQERLKRIARTVKMPGFRPGKVPFKMVEKNYGGQAHHDAMGAAVEHAYVQKIQAEKLRVAGSPSISPKEASAEGTVEFFADFEVYPEVVVADLSESAVERPVLEIGDADVERTLDVLRKQRAVYQEVDRASEKEDRVCVDFTGTLDGEVFEGGTASDVPVLVGGGQMLPEFDAQLVGMKKGETKTFPLTFPAEYQAKHLAGQTVQFQIVAKSVEEPQLPEIDAKFAKSLGVADGDVDKMRTEIKINLEREVKRRIQTKVRDQIFEVLVSSVTFNVPKALIQSECERMAESMKQEFIERNGKSGKMPEIQTSWFTEQATRRVKLGLLVSEIVSANNLQPKAEQLRALVEEMAQSYEQPEEVVRWYFSKRENLAPVNEMAIEANVIEWVLSKAKTVEKATSFEELMGSDAPAA